MFRKCALTQCEEKEIRVEELIKYTRSRDALKQIRPDGFRLRSFQDMRGTWQVGLYKPREVWAGGKPSQWFATEELAELYVVIQAIEF